MMLFGIALGLLMTAHANFAAGWSLWPAASSGTTPPAAATPAAATPAKDVTTPAKKSPSALEKVGSGTKNLLTRTKNALTFNKPAPPKRSIQPPNPYMPKPRPEDKKAWFDGLFAKKAPEKPKTPADWISLPRPN
jgi:hypothetical protein